MKATAVLDREVVYGRYYDPATGQFISSDPLVNITGRPYAYAGDDPVNSTDPLGLWGWNPISDITQAAGDVGHVVTQHWRGIVQGVIYVAGSALIASCTVATEGICAAFAFEVAGIEFSGGALLTSAAIGAAEHLGTYAASNECHSGAGYLEEAGIGFGIGFGESVGEEFTPLGGPAGQHTAPAGLLQSLLSFWSL